MVRLVLLFSMLSVVDPTSTNPTLVKSVQHPSTNPTVVDTLCAPKNGKLTLLIEAMIWVESRGDDSAYCKKEEAVGCLQIRPIMLLECNRILALQKSKLEYALVDRWNRGKSIEMFYVVNQHYNKTNSHELIARLWNGGPAWPNKINTRKYWNKVYRRLKKISKD